MIFVLLEQLMKEGYPRTVCDYCQSQLNTFHAFVRKAKTTSLRFESMLQELKPNDEENNETLYSNEMLSTTDIEYEMPQDDEIHEKRPNQSIEVEFLIDKAKVDIMSAGINGDDGLNTQICCVLFRFCAKFN